MLVLKLDFEKRIGQGLNDRCHYFNCIFLRQTISFDTVSGRDLSLCFLLAVSWASCSSRLHKGWPERRKVHAPSASLTKSPPFGKGRSREIENETRFPGTGSRGGTS